MADMKASCQCGALRATVEGDAQPRTVMCHCRDCQKRSGSPFGLIAYYPAQNVHVSGPAREYTRAADSGCSFTTGFCPECGSTVYAYSSRMPDIMGLTAGTMDSAPPLPSASVYEQGRHAWVIVPQDIPRHLQGRGS